MSLRWRVIILLILALILWKGFTYYSLFQSKNNFDSDLLILSPPEDAVGKVKVSVYYEALCSDSRNFILNQLVPTFEVLHKYIFIDFIPYGKAKTIEEGTTITFQCQHGALECQANKIHACGLDKISNQYIRLKYIACMIKDNIVPEEAGERCAKDLAINYAPIADCANGDYGSKLLKAYGILTHAVIPAITFIPTIEVDGSQKIPLAHLLKNLKGELCKILPPNTVECQ